MPNRNCDVTNKVWVFILSMVFILWTFELVQFKIKLPGLILAVNDRMWARRKLLLHISFSCWLLFPNNCSSTATSVMKEISLKKSLCTNLGGNGLLFLTMILRNSLYIRENLKSLQSYKELYKTIYNDLNSWNSFWQQFLWRTLKKEKRNLKNLGQVLLSHIWV